MGFIAHTNEELRKLNITNGQKYTIEFLNRDYFNGDETIEKTTATAIIEDNGDYSFIITDDYGMDKFIKNVKIID